MAATSVVGTVHFVQLSVVFPLTYSIQQSMGPERIDV